MENQFCVEDEREKNWWSEIFRDCDESSNRAKIYNNKVKESCE